MVVFRGPVSKIARTLGGFVVAVLNGTPVENDNVDGVLPVSFEHEMVNGFLSLEMAAAASSLHGFFRVRDNTGLPEPGP